MKNMKYRVIILLLPLLFVATGCNNKENNNGEVYSVDSVIAYLNKQKNHAVETTETKDEGGVYTSFTRSFSYLRSSDKFGLYYHYFYSSDGFSSVLKIEGTFRWDNFENGDFSGKTVVTSTSSNSYSIRVNLDNLKVNACPKIDSCTYNVVEYSGTISESNYASVKLDCITGLRTITTFANNITTSIDSSLTLW